ncbi:MAG: hypothetical protein KIS66_18105 [Fimbriimonadaceae bacterium]|nr:hypothetical protein [Fimbriimonadaceae bacterium]
MSQDEAMAVMELYQAQVREQEAVASMPSTADLAEALRIPEAQVRAMLEQVRLRRTLDAYRAPNVANRTTPGMSAAIIASLVVVFVILAVGLLFVSLRAEVAVPAEAPRATSTAEMPPPDSVAPTPLPSDGAREGTPVPSDAR